MHFTWSARNGTAAPGSGGSPTNRATIAAIKFVSPAPDSAETITASRASADESASCQARSRSDLLATKNALGFAAISSRSIELEW